MKLSGMRAVMGLTASLALSALIIQVFQSSGSTNELLRGHVWESLDATKPASPIQYWGLGGIGRPHPWHSMKYSSLVHFKKHRGGEAHHAKLVHFKHNALFERVARGLPGTPNGGDMVSRLQPGANGELLLRHMKKGKLQRPMKAGLFDKEDSDAPMGTHFVTSPDHPQYVKAREVAARNDRHEWTASGAESSAVNHAHAEGKTYEKDAEEAAEVAEAEGDRVAEQGAERPVRAGSGEHDLSESVSPSEAMGTHFITSPEHPAEHAMPDARRASRKEV